MSTSKLTRLALLALLAVVVGTACGGSQQQPRKLAAFIHKVVYYTPVGNDPICRRNLRSRPCQTLPRVCQLARAGDFVTLIGGARIGRQVACFVDLTTPTQGAVLVGTNTVSAVCGNALAACTDVQFRIDGSTFCTDSTQPFSCPWDTTTATDGPHTLQAVADLAGGATRFSQTVTVTVNNGGAPTTAVVFVSTTGSAACGRSTVGPVSFSTAVVNGNVCDNFQHAYNVSQCPAGVGDTVLMEFGTYSAQEIDRTATDKACGAGTCDQSQVDASTPPTGTTIGCITFAPDLSTSCTPTSVEFGANASTSNFIWTNADYLRLDGMGCMTVYGSIAIVAKSAARLGKADSCNSGWGHDDIVQNAIADGQFDTTISASQGTFQVQGTTRVSLIGDTFKDAVGSTGAGVVNRLEDCAGVICSTLPNPCPPGANVPDTYSAINNTTLNHVTILDEVKTVASSGHCEGIHMEDNGGLITILNSKFLDLCEQDISLEPEAPTAAPPRILGLHIENTVFDYPSSHSVALGFADTFNPSAFGSITIICHLPGTTTFSDITFRNDSFINKAGAGGFIKYQSDPGCTGSFASNVATGDILTSLGSCAFWATVTKNLVPTGVGCGSDIAYGSAIFPYNDPANYDVSLNPATAGPAFGAIPLAVGYPTTDANGTPRPNPADTGALQH